MTHQLQVMTPARGHATITFDPTNAQDVEEVRTQFDELITRGFMGFSDGIPTATFDPAAATTLVTPLVVAG